MKPLVSVVILSYNQSQYVLGAVESVIAQTYDNWEAIVIDNGSTDGSQELLRRYASQPRIRLVFHDRNGHITVRSNEGVALARGEYVCFLYSDDYYLPEKLEKQVACFAGLSKEWGVVHGPGYGENVFTGKRVTESCISASGYVLPDLLTRYFEGFINPISPLIRRECLQHWRFYEDLFTEGEGIYFKLAINYKFYYLEEPLVVMREHDRNMRFVNKKNTHILDAVLSRLSNNPEFPEQYLPILRSFWGRIMSCNAWINIRMNMDAKWARDVYSKSVRADWHQMFAFKTVVGFLLTFIPKPAVERLNDLINFFTKREKLLYIEEYYR